VSQLADKSGNGRHQLQATGTKQPTTGTRTIGGRNAILTAAGTGLVTAAFAQGPSFTVYAVVQGDSTAGQRAITDNDGSPRIGQQRWTGPDLEAIGFSGGTPKFATGTGATNPFALAAHFVAFVFDSAAQTITIEADGVQKAQVTSTGALNSGTLGFSFGNNLATNAGMVGAVGEVFLSAAADGTGARANALAYARTKWGTP
jgi:hypothetical protein